MFGLLSFVVFRQEQQKAFIASGNDVHLQVLDHALLAIQGKCLLIGGIIMELGFIELDYWEFGRVNFIHSLVIILHISNIRSVNFEPSF